MSAVCARKIWGKSPRADFGIGSSGWSQWREDHLIYNSQDLIEKPSPTELWAALPRNPTCRIAWEIITGEFMIIQNCCKVLDQICNTVSVKLSLEGCHRWWKEIEFPFFGVILRFLTTFDKQFRQTHRWNFPQTFAAVRLVSQLGVAKILRKSWLAFFVK